MATRSENEFRDLVNLSNQIPIKLPDRAVCQSCGTVIFKQHLYWPDFIVPTAGHLVEVKESKEYFSLARISEEQRDRLEMWDKLSEKHNSWLFLEIGEKPAPNGRSAFMIPWCDFTSIEREMIQVGQKSVGKLSKRNMGADDMFRYYRLDWIKGVGWYPPTVHPWRAHMK